MTLWFHPGQPSDADLAALHRLADRCQRPSPPVAKWMRELAQVEATRRGCQGERVEPLMPRVDVWPMSPAERWAAVREVLPLATLFDPPWSRAMGRLLAQLLAALTIGTITAAYATAAERGASGFGVEAPDFDCAG